MFYPAFLKIAGKKCVVVGGGAVAARKAKTLLDAGAELVVVAPEFSPEMKKIAGEQAERIKIRREGIQENGPAGARSSP